MAEEISTLRKALMPEVLDVGFQCGWIGFCVIVSGRMGVSLCPTDADAGEILVFGQTLQRMHQATAKMVAWMQSTAQYLRWCMVYNSLRATRHMVALERETQDSMIPWTTLRSLRWTANYKLQMHEHKTQQSCPCGAKVMLCADTCLHMHRDDMQKQRASGFFMVGVGLRRSVLSRM